MASTVRPCPCPPHLVSRLRTLALTSPPATALFYARLWHALLPPTPENHECLHVLALCYLQAGQPYNALGWVRDFAEPIPEHADHSLPIGQRGSSGCYACAMIVGRCCDAVGRFSEGKAVVERALKRLTPTALPTLSPVSTSATAQLLMATLSRKGKAPEQAAEGYARALSEDPWLWEAFIGLCDIGAPPSPESLFPNPTVPRSHSSRPLTLSPNPMPRSSASEMPGIPARRQLSPLTNGSSGGLFTPEVGGHASLPRVPMLGNPSSWDTPSVAGDTTFPAIAEHLPPPSRRPLPNLISAFIPSLQSTFRATTPTSTPSNMDPVVNRPPAMKRPRGGNVKKAVETPQNSLPQRHTGRDLKSIEPNGEEGAPVRRSSRLKTTGSAVKPNTKVSRDPTRSTRSRSATSMSSASVATIDLQSPPVSDATQNATDDWLRDILRRCARAYRSLSMYACQDVIDEISQFPLDRFKFYWLIDLLARAHYEMADYKESRRYFEYIVAAEPYTLQSMECLSTLLWHLGDAPHLSSLSQWLMTVDREAPQPWIAAGNCFSLQHNHDEAMRCFRRATQVDPNCAYAWTLCGYEAIEMEEYDRAMAFYRTAIRTDSRHYNAWYGMGLVYLKTGKPKYAEHHFRRAAEINPTSPVLLCCIGMVLEQTDDVVQALAFYDQACKYAPESSMPAYRRIRVLVALQRIEEAIALLEPLTKTAPDEANIQFLLAKCYLKTGRRGEATVCFTAARELQPKLEGAIKIAMGGGDEEDEED